MPNAAAGASAPMLRFESPASAGLSNLYLAEAKSADAVLPNAAAGASAPMLQFESPASAGLSNLYLAEAKSADAILPNAAAGASAPMLQFESPASAGLSNFSCFHSITSDVSKESNSHQSPSRPDLLKPISDPCLPSGSDWLHSHRTGEFMCLNEKRFKSLKTCSPDKSGICTSNFNIFKKGLAHSEKIL